MADKKAHFLELCRHIHLNPVRVHGTETPEAYPYSSYRSFVDPPHETFNHRDFIFALSHGPEGSRRFVEPALLEELQSP